jgi:hypothetical protein
MVGDDEWIVFAEGFDAIASGLTEGLPPELRKTIDDGVVGLRGNLQEYGLEETQAVTRAFLLAAIEAFKLVQDMALPTHAKGEEVKHVIEIGLMPFVLTAHRLERSHR